MTNKQSTQSTQETEVNPLVGERIGANLLLRGWNMALQVVNEAVQHNIKSGVRYPERFTSTVEQAFKNAIPTTDKTLRGVSLVLIRDGAPHVIGLQPEDNNIDSFVNKPFDDLYEKAFRPATSNVTNINIDPKQLEAFLKYQQEHRDDAQYG